MESGRILLNKNGQIFKTIKNENIKLWPGSMGLTPCIEAIGMVNDIPTEVVILEKDLKDFTDITTILNMINNKYEEITGEISDDYGLLQVQNRKLTIDLDKLQEEVGKYKKSLQDIQNDLTEKEQIISEFENSPEDIRKTSKGKGLEDIIINLRSRGRNAE